MALLQPTSYPNCSLQSIPFPALPGAKIERLEAISAYKRWQWVPAGIYSNNGPVTASDLRFCNVTITYTPLDLKSSTTVQIFLPLKWNKRMQAVGGSGWTAGLTDVTSWGMVGMAADGYAAITTNGGISSDNPREWAFSSPGKIDMKRLEHYASRSLNDLAVLGKTVIQSFYGEQPIYSYWNGCSQGGRQGLMLAQKYPKQFNGIIASAPAADWSRLLVSGFWAQSLMNDMGAYPDGCQIGALTAAAVKHCDPKDGVVDNMISDPDGCDFDPFTMVGNSTFCVLTGRPVTITKEAARVAYTGWHGLEKARNKFLHYGSTHEAPQTTQGMPLIGPLLYYMGYTEGLADVTCAPDGSKCKGKPHPIVEDWIRVFLLKDPDFNSSKISLKMLDDVFEQSQKEYDEVIGTNSPNLTEFRKAGGKILQYHGLADPVIPSKNTRRYYDSAMRADPKVHDFFRYFEAPGVAHCYSGSGLYPQGILNSMLKWVEHGEVPDKLIVDYPTLIGPRRDRILCPYPQRSRYNGTGNIWSKDSYYCS